MLTNTKTKPIEEIKEDNESDDDFADELGRTDEVIDLD